MTSTRALMALLAIGFGVIALSACDITRVTDPAGDDSAAGDSTGGDTPPDTTGPGGPSAPGDTSAPDGGFPRVCAFIGDWSAYSAGEQDDIARFGLITLRGDPGEVREIRLRNPDARLFRRTMPQIVPETDWGEEWSWEDVVREYAAANDWIMRHHNGEEAVARGWGTYWRWGDFTSHCPLGTYSEPDHPELDSTGLTMAEWMATRFIPWFVETQMTGYEGLWWEVVAERPNQYWWYRDTPSGTGGLLDWNRNGVADWTEGGQAEFDRFVEDWVEVTTWWIQEVRRQLGPDYPIIAGGDVFTPPLEYFHGFKNEDWMNRNRWSGPRWTWWDEFYNTHTTYPRRGYVFQRDHALAGWSLSINQVSWRNDARWQWDDPESMRRYVRLFLGTTLLGDGYFCLVDTETRSATTARNPWVSEYYDLELGDVADPYRREIFSGDTLYTRTFRDTDGNPTGYVAVNPYDHPVGGVPAEDAIFETYAPRDPGD